VKLPDIHPKAPELAAAVLVIVGLIIVVVTL